MKKISLALALGLGSLMFGSAAFADSECPPGQFLKKIGEAKTATAVISTQGVEVRAISIQCGGTACVGGFYDEDAEVDVLLANLVLEVGTIANTSILFPESGFLSTPIRFSTGLVFIDNGNVAQITFLGCSQ